MGKLVGRNLQRLVTQVCRKRKLDQSLEKIAEDLVEDVSAIKPIYDVAGKFAPECDPEAVMRELDAAASPGEATKELKLLADGNSGKSFGER